MYLSRVLNSSRAPREGQGVCELDHRRGDQLAAAPPPQRRDHQVHGARAHARGLQQGRGQGVQVDAHAAAAAVHGPGPQEARELRGVGHGFHQGRPGSQHPRGAALPQLSGYV